MSTQNLAVESAPARHVPYEEPSPWERLSFASGIAAAAFSLTGAALFIAFVVPDLPALDAPAAERAAFYAEMSRNLLYRSVSYIGELQMLLLLLFFGGLFGVLRRSEGGSGALSLAVFGAGIALSVISPLAIMIEDFLVLGFAEAGVDPAIVTNLDGFGPLSFALSGFPRVLVLCGTAALLLPRRLMPRWLGWSGVALAVLSLLGTGTLVAAEIFPLAAVSMLLFYLWIATFSIGALRTGGRANPVAGREVSPVQPAWLG